MSKFINIKSKVLEIQLDLIAGISIAGLLLPEAIAYASIARLPPHTGIMALFSGLFCYGLLGQSRFAIVAATSSSAAILAATIGSILPESQIDPDTKTALIAALVFLTGLLFILAASLKLGNITAFIAKPVLKGFIFGLGTIIILGQINSMIGVHSEHNNFFGMLIDLFSQKQNWNNNHFLLGACALILLFSFSRFKKLPGALIVIALGIILGKYYTFAGADAATTTTSVHITLEKPQIPDLPFEQWLYLGVMSFAIMMVLYAESYGSIRNFAIKYNDKFTPNRDLLALGSANLLSGLLGGMPVGAGFSATSANEMAGARSKLSGWFALVVILILVLTLLPAIALIQKPVLAAIVIFAVSHTLNPKFIQPYFKWQRDRLLVIGTILAVLSLGILEGLLVAIALSIILMLRQFASASVNTLGRLGNSHNFVRIDIHPEAKAVPGILILQPAHPLFFANIESIFNRIGKITNQLDPSIHTIIISLEESPDLDSSSIEVLMDYYQYTQTVIHKNLFLARLKEPALDVLKLTHIPEKTLTDLSVDEAVKIASQSTESKISS